MSEKTRATRSRTPRRIGWALVCTALAAALPAPAPGLAAATVAPECATPAATISGTNGDDVLTGTPGADVIDALAGDDIVEGLGGNDVLIGGEGKDRLSGAAGDDLVLGGNGDDRLDGGRGIDRLCGENGIDVLLGGYGDDLLQGGSGADLLSGGPGDDDLAGGDGPDLAAGGPGADKLAGDEGDDALGGNGGDDVSSGANGNDRISGGDGQDQAAGDKGSDRCTAEQTTGCEGLADAGSITTSLSPATLVEAPPGYRLNWSASATAGTRLAELYADDQLVAHDVLASAPDAGGTFEVPLAALHSGDVSIYLVVTDANGDQSAAGPIVVSVAPELLPRPAAASIQLNEPTPMVVVVDLLMQAGLTPIEYRASDVATPAPTVTPEVASQAQSDGNELFVPPSVGIIYNPTGTPLVDQEEELLSYYRDRSIPGDPLIDHIVVEGPITAADLGPLGGRATLLGQAGPQPTGAGPAGATTARSSSSSATSQPSAGAQATAATPETAFWPLYGRFNVKEQDITRRVNTCTILLVNPACIFQRVAITEKKAELQHQLVWDRDVLAAFGTRNDAYEHNVKVISPGRSGIRPACNPVSADNFYVRAETSSIVEHNMPRSAQLYNDTATFDDGCDRNEVSFGVVHPERLLDAVPAGRLAVFSVKQVSIRNDATDRSVTFFSQTLSRDNASCDRLPPFLKMNCIGIRASETIDGKIAETGNPPLPDVRLPVCLVWKWVPAGPASGLPTLVRRCAADTDGDRYDDAIDCAPLDPAINPGAVDIPNDGIDQNCDGADLVVGQGAIQVTLLWDNNNDMDLHVIEHNGTRIWYASPGPTSTGGRLDRDDNVGSCGPGGDTEPGGVENIFWPRTTAPARGAYRVDVVQYSRCSESQASNWTAEVRVDGLLIRREAGVGGGNFSFAY